MKPEDADLNLAIRCLYSLSYRDEDEEIAKDIKALLDSALELRGRLKMRQAVSKRIQDLHTDIDDKYCAVGPRMSEDTKDSLLGIVKLLEKIVEGVK